MCLKTLVFSIGLDQRPGTARICAGVLSSLSKKSVQTDSSRSQFQLFQPLCGGELPVDMWELFPKLSVWLTSKDKRRQHC